MEVQTVERNMQAYAHMCKETQFDPLYSRARFLLAGMLGVFLNRNQGMEWQTGEEGKREGERERERKSKRQRTRERESEGERESG